MRIRNVMGTEFSGTIGKDTVAVQGRTTHYLRKYVVPRDPKTELQLEMRDLHRRAVAAWRGMRLVQQAFYRHLDLPRIGYHVFLSRALHALVAERPVETPVRMAWTVEGGPIEKGRLLVRRQDVVLFGPPLKETVEVALTPSDAPYAFALGKKFEEDEVLTMEGDAVAGPPPVLESARLGIRLVPKETAPPPPPPAG